MTYDRLYVHGRGEVSHDTVEQQLYAFVLERRAAKHGHHAHVDGSRTKGLDDLFGSDRIGILEEFLHKGIVGSGDLLYELSAPFGRLGRHVSGDIFVGEVVAHRLVVEVDDGTVVYEVHEALEFVFGTYGQHYGKRVGTETFVHLRHDTEEIGAGTVHLVDITDTGHTVFIRLTPHCLALGLYAAHGTERSDSTVEHTKRTFHLYGEVDVSRGVDDIDLVCFVVVFPEGSGSGRGDGDASLLLLYHPVHGSCTLVHLTHFVCLACIEKNTLGRGSLARIDVGHDTDVSGKMKVSCHLLILSG